MVHELTRYLNDHLAGSSGALLLIQDIADSHDASEAKEFFINLKELVQADRAVLEDLISRIGRNPSTLLKIAGGVAAHIATIKLLWEQMKPGKLGLFEALEMLSLGVHGKLLLWGTLREIADRIPEWNGVEFTKLELAAIQQRDVVEFWRIEAAKNTFS